MAFKFDKVNAAFMGLYIASDLAEMAIKKRKQKRIDAIEADFDERERLLRERLSLFEAEHEKAKREYEEQQLEDDLSWMD